MRLLCIKELYRQSLFTLPAGLEGVVPAGAECFGGELDIGGALGAFIVVAGDHAGDFADDGFGMPLGDDGFGGEVVLDVEFQDGVQLGVFGQGVLVFLSGAQLGGGGFGDGVFGDDFALAVDVAGKGVDVCFVEVADDAEGAAEVAVEGAVADCRLAVVGGVKGDVAELVGHCHDQHAADARLEVFFGDAKWQVAECRLEGSKVLVVDISDGDGRVGHAEVAGEGFGIAYGVVGGVMRGHEQSHDVFCAEGFGGKGGDNGGVDASRQPEDGFREAVFGKIVADAKAEGLVDERHAVGDEGRGRCCRLADFNGLEIFGEGGALHDGFSPGIVDCRTSVEKHGGAASDGIDIDEVFAVFLCQ